jgi:hypothetical protein
MGASAREIEQQINETRQRMDENLGALEERATNGAQRYGKVAAAIAGVAAVAVVGFVIWRKTRRPTLKDRLDKLSPDNLHDLAEELISRLKKPLPAVNVTVNPESEQEPGMVESILRKVAPAVVGTAATGLLQRVAPPPDEEEA